MTCEECERCGTVDETVEKCMQYIFYKDEQLKNTAKQITEITKLTFPQAYNALLVVDSEMVIIIYHMCEAIGLSFDEKIDVIRKSKNGGVKCCKE